jgi:hypothetical protein
MSFCQPPTLSIPAAVLAIADKATSSAVHDDALMLRHINVDAGQHRRARMRTKPHL